MPQDSQIRRCIKKDVGVCTLLIPPSGLGVPTRKISNADSPRQMNIQYSHVEHGARIYTEMDAPIAVSSSGIINRQV